MFDQSFKCPMGKDTKETKSCEGCRENGTLRQVCAGRCPAYKNYVKNLK